jgi:hypothetical protein
MYHHWTTLLLWKVFQIMNTSMFQEGIIKRTGQDRLVNKHDFCLHTVQVNLISLLSCCDVTVATVQSMPEHFPSYMAVLLSVGTLLPFIRHCTIHAVDTGGIPSSSNSFWRSTGQDRPQTTTSKCFNSLTPVNTNIKILSLHQYIMYSADKPKCFIS